MTYGVGVCKYVGRFAPGLLRSFKTACMYRFFPEVNSLIYAVVDEMFVASHQHKEHKMQVALEWLHNLAKRRLQALTMLLKDMETVVCNGDTQSSCVRT